MTNISGVNKNFPASHTADDKKTGRVNEAGRKASLQGSATQMNKLIVEFNLNIKVESKERFGTQAGINQMIKPSGIDLSQLIYNGKPITELSQDEANALISEDGYFGVKNTAQRIYDFVAGKAGEDPEKLQVARDAVLKGFKDAEAAFGGKLPDISYKTLDKLLEMIDAKISALGGSVVDLKA
jgi:hypothetical protein